MEKIISLTKIFIHGNCKGLNVKLNIWLDVPSKYIEDLCAIISVAVVIFSERLTDTSCWDFFICFLTFLQLTEMKMS